MLSGEGFYIQVSPAICTLPGDPGGAVDMLHQLIQLIVQQS